MWGAPSRYRERPRRVMESVPVIQQGLPRGRASASSVRKEMLDASPSVRGSLTTRVGGM